MFRTFCPLTNRFYLKLVRSGLLQEGLLQQPEGTPLGHKEKERRNGRRPHKLGGDQEGERSLFSPINGRQSSDRRRAAPVFESAVFCGATWRKSNCTLFAANRRPWSVQRRENPPDRSPPSSRPADHPVEGSTRSLAFGFRVAPRPPGRMTSAAARPLARSPPRRSSFLVCVTRGSRRRPAALGCSDEWTAAIIKPSHRPRGAESSGRGGRNKRAARTNFTPNTRKAERESISSPTSSRPTFREWTVEKEERKIGVSREGV